MNVDVEALNKAMKLSGKRLIGACHYAQAKKIVWPEARAELELLSRCGFVTRHRNGLFTVKEFSIDD
jgi:hypothetical protein